jgi:hypothetical protein
MYPYHLMRLHHRKPNQRHHLNRHLNPFYFGLNQRRRHLLL